MVVQGPSDFDGLVGHVGDHLNRPLDVMPEQAPIAVVRGHGIGVHQIVWPSNKLRELRGSRPEACMDRPIGITCGEPNEVVGDHARRLTLGGDSRDVVRLDLLAAPYGVPFGPGEANDSQTRSPR